MFGLFGNSKKSITESRGLDPKDGIVLKIEGMTCGHCKSSVEKALSKVPGVTRAEVDLARKQAVIMGSADRSELVKAVEEAGYEVIL